MSTRFIFGMFLKFLSLALEALAVWVIFGGRMSKHDLDIADFHVPIQREVARA